MLTDETALQSNAETEGTSDKTGSNTEPQQGPRAQQGSDADGSATTGDQQVNRPVLIILSFYSLNLKFIFNYMCIHVGFPIFIQYRVKSFFLTHQSLLLVSGFNCYKAGFISVSEFSNSNR